MPYSVLRDKELTPWTRLVYVELALWAMGGENTATRGTRAISEAIGVRQGTVSQCLRALVAHGHIAVLSKGRERGRYALLSQAFPGPRPKRLQLVSGKAG